MNRDSLGTLGQLGWNSFFEAEFRKLESTDWLPARVIIQQKNAYTVQGEKGVLKATVAGRLHYEVNSVRVLRSL